MRNRSLKRTRSRNRKNRSVNRVTGVIFTAITGAIAKDLVSDNSKIKHYFNLIFRPESLADNSGRSNILEAEYTVNNIEDKEIKE